MKFNHLIPELSVSNIEKSKYFYCNVLGFELTYERVNDNFAFLTYQKAQIMIEEINDNWNVGQLIRPFGRGVNFQIQTNEIDNISKKLKENHIEIFKDIFESEYAVKDRLYLEKELLVQDPDGYLLRFQQTLKK